LKTTFALFGFFTLPSQKGLGIEEVDILFPIFPTLKTGLSPIVLL
jgi:hypothetical protein